MAEKTRTIWHPTDNTVSYEVPESKVQGWKDQGWRVTEPAKKDTTGDK